MVNLITDHISIWTAAQTQNKNGGRGRGKNSNGQRSNGIKKLRELILELAVRGKLVPQDPNDEPASVLLEKIAKEKKRLIKEGKIKKQKKLPEISEDEKPFELPKGWGWTRLGNVTNYGILEKAEPGDVSENTWILELKDVEKETSKLLQKIRFTDRPFKSSKNRFYEGDVIYGKLRPYLDKVIVADESGVCTTEMIPLKGYENIAPPYLRLVMKSPYFIRYANESTHGMNLPRMGTDKAKLALFPMVSVGEQHRIVGKVDELMALCDQLEQQQTDSNATHETLVETLLAALTSVTDQDEFAKTWQQIADHFDALFTTEQSIDLLKQTILQLAVMGKLVPQDPNDEPAIVLLEKIGKEKTRLIKERKIKKQKKLPEINDDEKPFNLPKGWEWTRLGNIATFENGDRSSRYPKGSDLQTSGIPFFGAKDMVDGVLSFDNSLRFISEDKFSKLSNGKLFHQDFVTLLRGTVGKMAIFQANTQFSTGFINAQMIIIRMIDKDLCRFFSSYSSSTFFHSLIANKTTGTAVRQMPAKELFDFLIPLPPLAEQHRIITKVDELMALCEDLKSLLNDAQNTQVHLADAIVEQAVAL